MKNSSFRPKMNMQNAWNFLFIFKKNKKRENQLEKRTFIVLYLTKETKTRHEPC